MRSRAELGHEGGPVLYVLKRLIQQYPHLFLVLGGAWLISLPMSLNYYVDERIMSAYVIDGPIDELAYKVYSNRYWDVVSGLLFVAGAGIIGASLMTVFGPKLSRWLRP